MARGPSSRRVLDIDWRHPVYRVEEQVAEGRSRAKAQRKALPADEALNFIKGDDQRPLIVLRECKTCTGTEDALLSRNSDNERTYLLSRWFHCVKLPPDVLEDDHPFRNLFSGDVAAHLFVCNADGTGRRELSGSKMRSRSELWDAMGGAMAANYKQSTKKPLRALANLLDELDGIDLAVNEIETKLEIAIATDGIKDRRTKKLLRKRTDLLTKRSDLFDEVAQAFAMQLKLRIPKKDLDLPAKKAG